MQQRQPRLGDILDDYCPRERRVTNHAVVAMVGDDVKQTRCTTCDAEHDYKHAKVPRQRKKSDSPAVLYAQVLAGGPKKVAHDSVAAAPLPVSDHARDLVGNLVGNDARNDVPDDVPDEAGDEHDETDHDAIEPGSAPLHEVSMAPPHRGDAAFEPGEDSHRQTAEEGPVHRRLIRAQLPRIEGQPPPARQAPDFTIRQPAGRVNRFRPRNQRGAPGGGSQFQGPGNRSNHGNGHGSGNPSGPMRSGSQGHGSNTHGSQGHGTGRPPMVSRLAKRQGPGRKRSK